MPIPIVYRSAGSGVASYDWLDVTSGAGYRRYYPVASNLTGGTTYFLSTRLIDAPVDEIWVAGTIGTGADPTKIIDVDFDITMKLPAVIDGNCFINLTYTWTTDAATIAYIIVKINHVTAVGVETQIGTAQTGNQGGAAGQYFRETILAALTKKSFAIGEKLRLTVEGWGKAPSGAPVMRIYIDPNSGLTVTDTMSRTVRTDLTFDVPFKIEV